jgi:hypothetical protein
MRAVFIGATVGVIVLVLFSSSRFTARWEERKAARGVRGSANGRAIGPGKGPVDLGTDEPEYSRLVCGTWKQNREDARKDAFKKAQRALSDYFRSTRPGRVWSPTEYYIEHYLVQDLKEDDTFWKEIKKTFPKENKKFMGEIAPVQVEVDGRADGPYQVLEEKRDFGKEEKPGDERLMGPMVRVWLRVALSQEDLKDMETQDRKYRVQQQEEVRVDNVLDRLALAAKVLGTLVALLTVLTGYIRLDEFTKGFYTGWLRLAAVGLLAAVGVGLWWLP